MRRIPLDVVLRTDDGDLRFEGLDVYAEGCLLRYYYYLRDREDGTRRHPSMWLEDAHGGVSGIRFQVPGPDDLDSFDPASLPEPTPDWIGAGDFPPTPEPTVVVTDDRGNRYEGSPGGGGGNDEEHHCAHRITQPLDPEATELHVEVPELIWAHFPYAPPGESSTMVIDRIQPGPWRIAIGL